MIIIIIIMNFLYVYFCTQPLIIPQWMGTHVVNKMQEQYNTMHNFKQIDWKPCLPDLVAEGIRIWYRWYTNFHLLLIKLYLQISKSLRKPVNG